MNGDWTCLPCETWPSLLKRFIICGYILNIYSRNYTKVIHGNSVAYLCVICVNITIWFKAKFIILYVGCKGNFLFVFVLLLFIVLMDPCRIWQLLENIPTCEYFGQHVYLDYFNDQNAKHCFQVLLPSIASIEVSNQSKYFVLLSFYQHLSPGWSWTNNIIILSGLVLGEVLMCPGMLGCSVCGALLSQNNIPADNTSWNCSSQPVKVVV